ncbi:MAG: gamma-glutamylcyclotransferase family protein [Ferruginibacter sp.]
MYPDCNRLFVYGSLRSGFRNPAYNYLTKYFDLQGEAVVQGKFYDQGEYPVAIPFDGPAYISGELYEVKNKEELPWALEQLDDYEGLNVTSGKNARYRREIVTAYKDAEPFEAWIYWFNEDVTGLKEITTGDIMQYLQQQNKPG